MSNKKQNHKKYNNQNQDNKEVKDKLIKTDRGEEFTEEDWVTPIFGGGPTRQEVEEWKDKYTDIYYTPYDDDIYIWRPLYRSEYREVITNESYTIHDREEVFTEKCVLFPRNYSLDKVKEGKAGVPSLLAEAIMEKSGFIAQTAPIKL